jgi:hypothetical protein
VGWCSQRIDGVGATPEPDVGESEWVWLLARQNVFTGTEQEEESEPHQVCCCFGGGGSFGTCNGASVVKCLERDRELAFRGSVHFSKATEDTC